MYPTFETFMTMAGQADRITLYKEVGADMDTPVSILSKLMGLDRVILLESAKGDKTYSRFSFLAFDEHQCRQYAFFLRYIGKYDGLESWNLSGGAGV